MSRNCCNAEESPDVRPLPPLLAVLPPLERLLPDPLLLGRLLLELPPLELLLLEPLPLELLRLELPPLGRLLLELPPLELLPLELPLLELLPLDPPLLDRLLLEVESRGTCLVWANSVLVEAIASPPPAQNTANIFESNLRRESIMFPSLG